MIELKTSSDADVLCFRLSGKLTAIDYETVLMPAIDAQVARLGKARVLIEWTNDFKGWEAAAMIDDAKLGFQHWNHFSRIALVGAPGWVEVFAKGFDMISKGLIKTFDDDDLDDAWQWAKS